MRAQILSLVAAAAAVSAQGTSAPVVQNNPIGAQYIAQLPVKASSSVAGSVQIETAPDGKGVSVSVAISGLPAEGGPFLYHVHEKPVPADGNCTGTGAHLDPYKRGEDPPCDSTKPETCQVGDLSGKHGKPTGRDYTAKYTDLYIATKESDPAYFGKLSIVVHLANKTRISCANFTLNSAGAVSSTPVSVGTLSGYPAPTGSGNGTYSNNTLTMSPTATGTGSGTTGAGKTTGSPIPPTSAPLPHPSSNVAVKAIAGTGAFMAAAAAAVLL